MEILIALVGILIGLACGWKVRDMSDNITKIIQKKSVKPFVTNPYVEAKPYNTSNAIVTPKSPQQLQNEAFEKAKRGDL